MNVNGSYCRRSLIFFLLCLSNWVRANDLITKSQSESNGKLAIRDEDATHRLNTFCFEHKHSSENIFRIVLFVRAPLHRSLERDKTVLKPVALEPATFDHFWVAHEFGMSAEVLAQICVERAREGLCVCGCCAAVALSSHPQICEEMHSYIDAITWSTASIIFDFTLNSVIHLASNRIRFDASNEMCLHSNVNFGIGWLLGAEWWAWIGW